MPKGEHFKKPNPRIHQVSFKLNATELAEMKRIVASSGKSLPQFLRDIIFNESSEINQQGSIEVPIAEVSVDKTGGIVPEPEPVDPIIVTPEEKKPIEEPLKPVAQKPKPAEKKKEEETPKFEPRKDDNNQFSLF